MTDRDEEHIHSYKKRMVGYNIRNRECLSREYICRYCSLLLRDPVQLFDCGHRHCQSCIDEQKGEMINCAECHEKTSRNKSILDRGFRNDMQTLAIACALCDWNGLLKDYQNHLNQIHSNPTCIYCNQKFTSVDDLNKHMQFSCAKVLINCPLWDIGCEKQILRQDLGQHCLTERHQEVIIKFILEIHHGQRTSVSNNQLEEVNMAINSLMNGAETLSEDTTRLTNQYTQYENSLQMFIEGLSILKKSIEDQTNFVNNMKQNLVQFENDIALASREFEEIKLKSHDGTYIWKIDNVREKLVAAQSGTQISIDSPPFYSSPTGYKMCVRLFFNGDARAQGRFISIYFVQMRGEFDAILNYPFCFNLIFCLHDQTNEQKHIIQKLRPNVLSEEYKRPRTDLTVAGGISEFASLESLRRENNPYIRDDTMFIKIMIDFNNIPENVLPYAMNLSSALNTTMQQSMIQEEREKHRRM